ncbi:MAG: NifB/NifX family molybdenum-iron cluster-binding protein [Candidatus Hinthialibacter antarcticus]|nr:NifB/NifX family molybdenum-iron cluster-binding protein [Candidatus Hinthialibacter antarcticus]
MKIAVPVINEKLAAHFGHCEHFALLEVDSSAGQVTSKTLVTPPPHEPGVLPLWLHQQGADVIICGGMGIKAKQLFDQYSIRVVIGAPEELPEALAKQFLEGSLQTGENLCTH